MNKEKYDICEQKKMERKLRNLLLEEVNKLKENIDEQEHNFIFDNIFRIIKKIYSESSQEVTDVCLCSDFKDKNKLIRTVEDIIKQFKITGICTTNMVKSNNININNSTNISQTLNIDVMQTIKEEIGNAKLNKSNIAEQKLLEYIKTVVVQRNDWHLNYLELFEFYDQNKRSSTKELTAKTIQTYVSNFNRWFKAKYGERLIKNKMKAFTDGYYLEQSIWNKYIK